MSQDATLRTSLFPTRFPNETIAAALQLLATSQQLAQSVARDPWEFAVTIDELRQAGAATSELRWLIARDFAIHAFETTATDAGRRSFSATGAVVFSRASCFVITQAGLDHTQCQRIHGDVWHEAWPSPHQAGQNIKGLSTQKQTPTYDEMRAELRVAGQIVKRFRRSAPNQQAVLLAFEEAAWSHRIDDPLPATFQICPKRRLNETIKTLNSRHLRSVVRFSGDGTGQGVRWDFDE